MVNGVNGVNGNGKRRSILVVDDEQHIRVKLSAALEREGYAVATAESGERAIRMCMRRDYDCVLMDARLPGLDGVEVLRALRRGRCEARVIVMSAYGIGEIEKVVLREGALAFLRKPIDVQRVHRLMEQAPEPSLA